MSDQNLAAIENYLHALESGDMSAILECFAEDVEYLPPTAGDKLPWKSSYTGHEGVVEFTETADRFAKFKITPYSMLANDDTVVFLGHDELSSKATGRSCPHDLAAVFKIRDGKITRVQLLQDTYGIYKAFCDD